MKEFWLMGRAIAAAIRLNSRQMLTLGLIFGLIMGLVVGLTVGWIIWPVGYAGEVSISQVLYVEMVADLFAFDRNQARVKQAMAWPDAAATTCVMMQYSTDEGRRVRLWMILLVLDEECHE
ncbi:MAG: hypothetical protein V9G20_32670 [Candidatus Promineifilaceae bacterium]